MKFDHGFCFPKLVFLNSILPLNIGFRVIELIFKECHIHGGVELFYDEKVTLIEEYPRKIHLVALGQTYFDVVGECEQRLSNQKPLVEWRKQAESWAMI